MNTPFVENMESPRTNHKVANQFVMTIDNDKYFQSYSSMIAVKRFSLSPQILLDKTYWDYSRTTLKYLTQFLRFYTGEAINSKKDIEKKIKDGSYCLTNLN